KVVLNSDNKKFGGYGNADESIIYETEDYKFDNRQHSMLFRPFKVRSQTEVHLKNFIETFFIQMNPQTLLL
ncbi:hypothetical protein A3Q56_08521, partial [Intoshia linei]